MSINKFGHYSDELHSKVFTYSPVNTGFSRTRDGNFDISSKRLVNVAYPQDNNDACIKEYVDTAANELKDEISPRVSKMEQHIINLDSKIDRIVKILPEMAANEYRKIEAELRNFFLQEMSESISNLQHKFDEIINTIPHTVANEYEKMHLHLRQSLMQELSKLIENKKLTNIVVINLVLKLNEEIYEVLNSPNDFNDDCYSTPFDGKIMQINYSCPISTKVDALLNTNTPLLIGTVVKKNDKIRFYPRKIGQYPLKMYVEIIMLANV